LQLQYGFDWDDENKKVGNHVHDCIERNGSGLLVSHPREREKMLLGHGH
jgi:hypothetical protein